MKFAYREDVRIVLFVLSAIFFLACPMYLTEFFFPTILGLDGLPYLVFAFFCFTEGNILLYTGLKYGKLEPKKICKSIASYEIAINPVFALVTIFLSVILPRGEYSWFYYFNSILTVTLFVLRLFFSIFLSKLMEKGDDGYVGIRNHSWIAASFLAVVGNYYVLSAIKASGIPLSEIIDKGLGAITDLFAFITVFEVLVGAFILMQSLLMTVATFYSAKEDTAIDLKTNLHVTKSLLEKYDVSFWIGIAMTALLWILSIVSTIRLFDAYFSLTFLYTVILLIRLPAWARNKRIAKKYGYDEYKSWVKRHGILIYSAFLLIAYAVIIIVFGGQTYGKAKTQIEFRTELMTLGIFFPWALVKNFLGARAYRSALKSGEPSDLLMAYLDILVAIYTISKCVFILASYTQLEWIRVSSTVLGYILSIYCVYASVRILVLGILGLNGKRKNVFEKVAQARPLAFLPKPKERKSRKGKK